MRLVYKFKLNNKEVHDALLPLCRFTKDLYNQTLYATNESKRNTGKYLTYNQLDKIMQSTYNLEGEVNYRKLKAQVAQQTIKAVTTNISNYSKAIKDWKVNPKKYTGMPKFPKYLPKKGYRQLEYTNQCSKIKDGKLYLSRDLYIDIPQYDEYKDKLQRYQGVRIVPRRNGSVIWVELIYLVDDPNPNLELKEYASIDLGVNNLVTMVTSVTKPIIYNGRQIKSINQKLNKNVAKAKSLLASNNSKGREYPRQKSKLIDKLYENRDNLIKDLMHKVSRHIVDFLVDNGIGTLIVGYNKGWKDFIEMGKKNNQNFAYIPFDTLVKMIQYKCENAGIVVVINEESYTSLCDSLALESICEHKEYMGERVERGLFQSSTGTLINADVNGALNIMRKVVGDSVARQIARRGLLLNPLKHGNLFLLGKRRSGL